MSDQPPVASRESRAQVRTMLVIGAVASALGIALALLIDWFPVPASEQAGPIDTLWDVLLIASVPVFVLVETIVLFCAIKFRMQPGRGAQGRPADPRQHAARDHLDRDPGDPARRLCTYAYVVLTDIEKAEANAMNVRVVGEQFTWTFYYPGEGGEEIASTQLYLPAEHAGELHGPVQGRDPRLLGAGLPHEDRRRAGDRHAHPRDDDRTGMGEFPVVCAELCGLGHSTMRQSAHVVSREDFDAKLAELAAGPAGRRAAAAAAAARPTARRCSRTPPQPTACASCHTLADAGATGTTGPNLDEVVPDLSDERASSESIVDPDAEIAEGFQPGLMPRYGDSLSEEQVDALVKYLKEVAGR